jgi:hypothetical protein
MASPEGAGCGPFTLSGTKKLKPPRSLLLRRAGDLGALDLASFFTSAAPPPGASKTRGVLTF